MYSPKHLPDVICGYLFIFNFFPQITYYIFSSTVTIFFKWIWYPPNKAAALAEARIMDCSMIKYDPGLPLVAEEMMRKTSTRSQLLYKPMSAFLNLLRVKVVFIIFYLLIVAFVRLCCFLDAFQVEILTQASVFL